MFKTLNFIIDPKRIGFDNPSKIITNLSRIIDIAPALDLFKINDEVDVLISKLDMMTDKECYDIVMSELCGKFEALLSWMPEVIDIVPYKERQIKELEQFFIKLNQLHIPYFADEKNKITFSYIHAGLRVLKLRQDLEIILNQVHQRFRDVIEPKDEPKIKAIDFNIKLSPDKTQEFARAIFKMYNDRFFIPSKPGVLVSEIDVLDAIGQFFDINILHAEWFVPDFYFSDNTVSGTATAPEVTPAPVGVLLSFFNCDEPFLVKLKNEFQLEKGKSIRILMHVLEQYEPKLLHIPYRKGKLFHKSIKGFFNRDIGSYQSIFNYPVDERIDRHEIENFKMRVVKIFDASAIQS